MVFLYFLGGSIFALTLMSGTHIKYNANPGLPRNYCPLHNPHRCLSS